MKQIFIVEDDQDIRELIEYLLISRNYEVTTFGTAEAFNKGISAAHPDLVLMDIMLPDGNGVEMCQTLFENQQTNSIPVVLMSAHTDPSKFDNHCARDFISKPFDVDDFLERIQRQLN